MKEILPVTACGHQSLWHGKISGIETEIRFELERPAYHRLPERIRTHAMICFMVLTTIPYCSLIFVNYTSCIIAPSQQSGSQT